MRNRRTIILAVLGAAGACVLALAFTTGSGRRMTFARGPVWVVLAAH
jgi:hypothetical protein